MAKIPTFEATVAPTAEVGAVKSNIQVSPKSSLAGALLPAADAITQFYVKEKEISNKVEGGQLIADANQELLEIKEQAKLKATPDEGVNFFNASYKQVVDKYKSKASNNYIQRYFDLNIASNKPSYINNILKQTRANMVKTRVDQVSRIVSNKITTAVEDKNTFNFAILAESITADYQGLVNDGLISEADLEIYKRQLPALIETEMVRKIANEDAFAALVSLDDPKNYSSITGEDRLKLKKELRELSTFQKNIVEYTVNSEGLKYKKKVSEALQGNKSTATLGIKPDELSLYYSTGNKEFDNQITELNNKVINNKISKDNNYLTNDKIIKKILNNEIKHPFQEFLLSGETEAKSITQRVGDGSINLDDDNFFNNIFENQQNPKLIEANKQFFNFMDKVIPLIEGSVSSKYFDENYNNRLSSFRQTMHSRFMEGVKNNIPVAQLLDSTSDNYIAKDILDYTPTKSQVRDALLNTAKKETVVENTFFKKRVDETPSQYLDRIQEHYVKEDGSFDKRKIKEMTREDVMKGSILDGGTFQDTDNEFNFIESFKEGVDKISNFFISKAGAAEITLDNENKFSNVDFDYIVEELEGGVELKGYVLDPKKFGNSGVTVAGGVDLSDKNLDELKKNLPDKLVKKLEPYLGLKGYDAQKKLNETPLSITEEEATILNKYIQKDILRKLKKNWKEATGESFDNLSEEQATVVASVAFLYGDLETQTPKFWKYVTAKNQDGEYVGEWMNAYRELMDFKDKSTSINERHKKAAKLLLKFFNKK
jgi:hypothetical protein|tara:strand:- start:2246 stop:4558 length:2313 start_codon:yes stop_codon:yes gene_type:complete